MSFIKVYIHLVWSTKNREPFLVTPALRRRVWEHMWENARQKNICIDMINGYEDHCHCLVALRADQSIAKVVQMIKGEASYWINKENICPKRFEWQEEYFALSVSDSAIQSVRDYIKNQEVHHSTVNFNEEFDELAKKVRVN